MNERKKILWLVSWYPNKNDRFDGDFIQRHARAAAIHHDIHVIYVTDADLDHGLEEEWHHATGLSEQIIYFKTTSGFLRKTRKLVVWKSLFRGAVKRYIREHGRPDLVHVHVPWKAGLIAVWIKKSWGIPYLITEHWGIYNHPVLDHFQKRSPYTQRLLRRLFREAALCTTVSRYLALGIEKMTGRPCERLIPNVVDTSLFFPAGEKYSKFSFIHVSNMAPVKNAGPILRAFRELLELEKDRPVQLIMVGNRNEEAVDLASQLDILNTSVFFKGEISYAEVAEEMKRCHCLVLFSDSETFSCVTAEALCTGLPVVASRVGALPELVDEKNGLLVEPGNLKELVHAMRQVLTGAFSVDSGSIAEDAAKRYGYGTVAAHFDGLYRSPLPPEPVNKARTGPKSTAA